MADVASRDLAPTWTHGPAFLASCFNYAASSDSFSSAFREDLSSASVWDALRPAFNLPVILLEEFKRSRNAEKHWKQKRWWQPQVDSAGDREEMASHSPVRLRKLKELMAAPFSVDVTSLVAPGPDQPAISGGGWLLSARLRIGLALDEKDSRQCPGCSSPMDPVGDHALYCTQLGIYARHIDLSDEFAALCVEAGMSVQLEKGPGNLRPADVLAHGIENSPLAVDFLVVNPLQPSAYLAEVRQRKLARQTENLKVRVRMSACRLGRSFCPFATGSHRHVG